MAKDTIEELEFISDLLEKKEIRPVIDRKYSLNDIALAHKYVDDGHKKGTVVVNVASIEA